MEGLNWSYLHFIGFTHRELFLMQEDRDDPIYHLSKVLGWDFPVWFPESRHEFVRGELAKHTFEQYAALFAKTRARIVMHSDTEYPKNFHHIPHTPFYLSVLGMLKDCPFLGIVGSRDSTLYGHELVQHFAPALVRAGYGIVSGGALGIDAHAHAETLKAGGYTIAIIGTGINQFYPASHKSLYVDILKSWGAIISEFALGMWPMPYNFPMRNELIAGLSRWVLLIEAKEKSGTLITAQIAIELGRDVFVPPADYSRANSIGTNKLIQRGCAKLVLEPEDILIEYEYQTARPVAIVLPVFDSETTQKIYTAVNNGYAHPDKIIDQTGFSVDEVLVELSMLELGGHIKMLTDGTYTTTLWKK